MIFAGLLAAAAVTGGQACTPSAADRAWLEGARAAWRLQLRRIPEMTPPRDVSVILFDARCRWSSRQALERSAQARWSGSLHGGRVLLADGSRIPVGVTSFAGEGRTGSSFVMALPSVWESARVNGGPLGMPILTKAVLLHEASHVAQTALMARVGRLVRQKGFGDDFSDDSIQQRFEKQPGFTASVREETRLLFAAADTADEDQARILAQQALQLMTSRRKRWFSGDDAPLEEAEDLFLSMEGAGQYVGYSWLIAKEGGGLSKRSRFVALARARAGGASPRALPWCSRWSG